MIPTCPDCAAALLLVRTETRFYRIESMDAHGSISTGDCVEAVDDDDAGINFYCEPCDTYFDHDPEDGFTPSDV